MIWQSLSLWALRLRAVPSCLTDKWELLIQVSNGAEGLTCHQVTLEIMTLCAWEALQVDVCNKSKLIISWREQQLCLCPYGVMLTLPSGPPRSVTLEDLLIVYLKHVLNPFIKVLKIYFLSFFQGSGFGIFIHSLNKPFLIFSMCQMLASEMQRWTRQCLYN